MELTEQNVELKQAIHLMQVRAALENLIPQRVRAAAAVLACDAGSTAAAHTFQQPTAAADGADGSCKRWRDAVELSITKLIQIIIINMILKAPAVRVYSCQGLSLESGRQAKSAQHTSLVLHISVKDTVQRTS